MSRRTDAEVEALAVDETEETETGIQAVEKAPKAKKESVRGQLPEGYVTPVGLASILTERKLHTNRAGEQVPVQPQMVYSYMKNAPKDDPFPLEQITDSNGKERSAVKIEAGVEWWVRKNERAAARKHSAAEKAAKKAAKAAEAPADEAESGALAEEAE